MDQSSRRGRVDDLIDANLKTVYDSILQEDVPARFTDLLRQLEAREGSTPSSPPLPGPASARSSGRAPQASAGAGGGGD
jgi:hypothetical protein